MTETNPITQFVSAVERAAARDVDTTPAALATADADGRPSVRMVLLRGVDERGFVFHTNYQSRKARELEANPYGALVFTGRRSRNKFASRDQSSDYRQTSQTPILMAARAEVSSGRGRRPERDPRLAAAV